MRRLTVIAGILLLASSACALAVPRSHVVHEKRDFLPRQWVKRDRLASHNILPVRIGLTQSNLEDAHEHLMDVSDPDSPNYGQFWTAEQVLEHFSPSPEAVETVRDWLRAAGIGHATHSDNKAWFAFDLPVGQVEELLHTTFHEYENVETGDISLACDEYLVPAHVQKHIDFIKPGVHIHPIHNKRTGTAKRGLSSRSNKQFLSNTQNRPTRSHPGDLTNCDNTISPACVAALYKIPPSLGKPDSRNSLGIFESELQYWVQEDLDLFFANFTPRIPAGTHPIDVDIDGGVGTTTNVSLAGGEAELDLMLAYPIIYPQTITVYNVDDLLVQADPNDTYTYGFNTFLDALDGSYCTYSAYGETGNDPTLDQIYPDPRPGGYKGPLECGTYKPTNVISISYGGQEANVPVYYQKRQCNEYLKLGLQGVSILFASGDSGVSDYPAPYGNSGPTGCLGPQEDIFNPTWPNGCPYVTNVGATKVYPGQSVLQPESVVYDPAGHPYHVNYSSGGGFSNVYPVPAYQRDAVNTYLTRHTPPYESYAGFTNDTSSIGYTGASARGGVYNRIGRGIPDVSANGDNIAVYVAGDYELSGGTSASTPIFSSIINRVIEERYRIGKGPIGFLNPAMYKNPWAFNDIVNGSNPGCGTLGFKAAPGWDPASGLGTPDFPRLLALFLALP